MKLSDFFRIARKYRLLILLTPILMAFIVFLLTLNPAFKYSSATTLYTGFTSTSTVEMNKSSNYYTVNTAFDNLITIIKSRATQQEVCVRLLAQHLMLPRSDSRYLSQKAFLELNKITPAHIKALVVKPASLKFLDNFKIPRLNSDSLELINSSIPDYIDPEAYEETVKNLKDYMLMNDTNFVYKLLNYDHPHYSIDAISSVDVKRLDNSDLLEMKYESDDPGISQHTLLIYSEVCIKVYKRITENRSDDVIKYFEHQLNQAKANLRTAEDKLLSFNNSNKIINYSEQSRAVAMTKENLDKEYNDKKIKLAGVQAVIKNLEEKLGTQQQNQLNNTDLIDKRNRLGEINYQITSAETIGSTDLANLQNLTSLRKQADQLKIEIKNSVSQLSSNGSTSSGLPTAAITKEWIDNVVEAENLKASLGVLSERMVEQGKEYSAYAPAGSNIKRIEREIAVSEQRYLDILRSLNLAKLKMQDNELASNIKTFDIPYYPLSPVPTKRKVMVAFAAMLGLMIVLSYIVIRELLDNTLKNPGRATETIKIPVIGVIPKILLNPGKINLPSVLNRLLDIAVQYIELHLTENKTASKTKTLLFFSTMDREGKSVYVANLARKLAEQGKKVLILSYDHNLLRESNPSHSSESGNKTLGLYLPKFQGSRDKTIDLEHPFLMETEDNNSFELIRYRVNGAFYGINNYQDILSQNNTSLSYIPDFVLIELPSIMNNPYPVALLIHADLSILICRASRVWTEADQGALERFKKFTDDKVYVVLNGVDLSEIDSVLGVYSNKPG